jgi:hypothetical protein
MNNYLEYADKLTTHDQFNGNLRAKKTAIENIYYKIDSISEYSIYNIGKISEIGKILKYFYELHSDSFYDDAIIYSIGFNGYIDCLKGIQNNIIERKMKFANFVKKNKKAVFKNSYYASLKNNNPVKIPTNITNTAEYPFIRVVNLNLDFFSISSSEA